MGAGNHPRTRKGRKRRPRHGGKGHHGKRHDPHPGRAYHDGGTSTAPPPPNAPRLPGAHPPTHTAEASNGRRTDHRGHGTKAQAPREGNPTDRHAVDLPDPPTPAARPSPHSTDQARHPHLTAPPSHQPDTLRPALRTTTQARLTSTEAPRHNARPRHTAPQHATVQRATARRDATRHRAAHNDTTDPNLRD